MADVWTDPRTWAPSYVVLGSDLNTDVRDNLTALHNAMNGDLSADTNSKHAHKSGLLASRPAASKAGRFYFATDVKQCYLDDGSAWRHVGGSGAYDGFLRANTTDLASSPATSSHPWAEESGLWQISGNTLKLESGSSGVASLDTRGLLDRNFRCEMTFTVAGSGNIDVATVIKYADIQNYIFVQLTGSAFDIISFISGSTTPLASISFTPTAGRAYMFDILCYGDTVLAQLIDYVTFGEIWISCRHANVIHANLANATKIGVRMINSTDAVTSIACYI